MDGSKLVQHFYGTAFLPLRRKIVRKKSILTTQQNGNRTADAAVVG